MRTCHTLSINVLPEARRALMYILFKASAGASRNGAVVILLEGERVSELSGLASGLESTSIRGLGVILVSLGGIAMDCRLWKAKMDRLWVLFSLVT